MTSAFPRTKAQSVRRERRRTADLRRTSAPQWRESSPTDDSVVSAPSGAEKNTRTANEVQNGASHLPNRALSPPERDNNRVRIASKIREILECSQQSGTHERAAGRETQRNTHNEIRRKSYAISHVALSGSL